MAFKIKTSKNTMSYFEEISASTNLQPFILSKLAISMSLKSDIKLEANDFKTDSLGLELNRQTITGEYDDVYKSLIMLNEGFFIEDDIYFTKYLKAYLDRGARLIYSEFKYNRDFLLSLVSNNESI